MMQRAALYARVSTARQEQEQTIASQIASLKAAATAAAVTVADEHHYIDDGFSGSRLDRPALDALRDAAADGLLDIVFVHCPDRLARNFVHQQILIEELQKRGVQIHFVECPIGERPEDRLLVQMQGVIAEYERAKIVERTRRGRLHKIKAGQLLPFTHPPYGYAIVRTEQAPRGLLVVDEVQAQYVRAMYQWARDEGLSLCAIARRLNQLGVPSQRRPYWGVSSVHKVLTNPAYTGRAYYGKAEQVEPRKPMRLGGYRKVVKSSKQLKPREQWHEVRVEPILDEKLAHQARAALGRHRAWASRNTKSEYLLQSLITCGQCGLRMLGLPSSGRSGKDHYRYYVCRGRKSLELTCRTTRCRAPSIRVEQVDRVVWDALVQWLQSPRMLREEVAAWKNTRQSKVELTRERVRLQKSVRQIDTQIARLVDAYQRGAVTVDELKARRERLSAMQNAITAEDHHLRSEEMSRQRLDQIADDIRAFAETLTAGIEQLDFMGRQRLVRLLVERVVVSGDVVTIEHVVPLSGRFCGLHPRARALRYDEKTRASERTGEDPR
jgi:site-specific DNA recombinase